MYFVHNVPSDGKSVDNQLHICIGGLEERQDHARETSSIALVDAARSIDA